MKEEDQNKSDQTSLPLRRVENTSFLVPKSHNPGIPQPTRNCTIWSWLVHLHLFLYLWKCQGNKRAVAVSQLRNGSFKSVI